MRETGWKVGFEKQANWYLYFLWLGKGENYLKSSSLKTLENIMRPKPESYWRQFNMPNRP